jgi:Bacterial regulatory proteins, gntR family
MDEIADVAGIGVPPITSKSNDVHPTTGPRSSVAGLDLHLDRGGGGVRDSVMDAIREAIRSGRLVPGTRLPSSRALAADLGVARNTVARAYAELSAEGWLTSQHGSATLVSQRAGEVVRSVAAPPRQRAPRRLDNDLRPGHPDLSSFPRAEWSRAVKRALNAAPYAGPPGFQTQGFGTGVIIGSMGDPASAVDPYGHRPPTSAQAGANYRPTGSPPTRARY